MMKLASSSSATAVELLPLGADLECGGVAGGDVMIQQHSTNTSTRNSIVSPSTAVDPSSFTFSPSPTPPTHDHTQTTVTTLLSPATSFSSPTSASSYDPSSYWTLTLLPYLTTRPEFTHLPPEVTHHICTYLDAPSLALLGGTDKSTYSVSISHDLWTTHLERPFKSTWFDTSLITSSISPHISRRKDPRRYYIARYKLASKKKLKREEQYDLVWKQKRRARVVHYANDVLVVPGCAILAATFIAMMASELSLAASSHSSSISSYFSSHVTFTTLTFLPLLLLFLLLLSSTFLLYLTYYTDQTLLPNTFYQDSHSPLKTLVREPNGEPHLRHKLYLEAPSHASFVVSVWGAPICVAMIFVDVIGAATSSSSTSFFFIPLYISLTSFLFGRVLEYYTSSYQDRLDRLANLVSVIVPVGTFLVLLHLYLDEQQQQRYGNSTSSSSIYLLHVFIPLFVLEFLSLIYCWYCCIVNSSIKKAECAIYSTILLLIAAFEITLGTRVDGAAELSFGIVFLPLLLLALLFICVTLHSSADRHRRSVSQWSIPPTKSPRPELRIPV